MATSVLFEEQVEIPLNLRSLEDFRRWALSASFPERGRIDFLAGRIEVDMSPEDFFCHGVLKTELIGVFMKRVKRDSMGYLLTDSTRVSCPNADLSVEPDIVFVSHRAIATGQVRLIAKASAEPGRYIELEGPPDLVVEIVSDSSVGKDTRRLPAAYAQAGVGEFWLIDARGRELRFEIHHLHNAAYMAAQRDTDGFQSSTVFGCMFRLDRTLTHEGHWSFDLREK